MPPHTRKKSREIGKSQEKPTASKLPIHGAHLRVLSLQPISCPTGLPSGSDATSAPAHKKVAKSTRTSGEEGPHGAGDQPTQLAETEEEVNNPATLKSPLPLKQSNRKKAQKEARAHKVHEAGALGAPADDLAPTEKNEQTGTHSQVPLASQSERGAVRRLTFEVSQESRLPAASRCEVVTTDSAPTRVTRSKSAKKQNLRSAIREGPQQDDPRSSCTPKQRRLSDNTPTKSAKSRHKTNATGAETGEPASESGRGEKTAAQKQLPVTAAEAVETLGTVSPQPGRSRKTAKHNVVTASSKLLPTASAVRTTRALSKSSEEQSSKNSVPEHVKRRAKKGGPAYEQQAHSHDSPADVPVARYRTKAADVEVAKASLDKSRHERPLAQEPSPVHSAQANTAETNSSRHLPKKNVSWDKHLSTTFSSGASSGSAHSTARADLRSLKEHSMRSAVSEQIKQRPRTVTDASKRQHPPSGGTRAGSHISREWKNAAGVQLQHLVLESSEHRNTTTGSPPTPTSRRGTLETSSSRKLSKRMPDGKQTPVTTNSPPHTTAGPVARILSTSQNEQHASIVEEVKQFGDTSKQQHRSEDDEAGNISGARRRVTVPANVEGMSPLHLPVFELTRLTKSSAAASSPQLARRVTVPAHVEGMSPLHIPVFELSRLTKASAALSRLSLAGDMEDSSSSHPLVLESTRISQLNAGQSPRDQAEKGKTSSKPSHHHKHQWPTPWGDLLILDSTREGEKEPARRRDSTREGEVEPARRRDSTREGEVEPARRRDSTREEEEPARRRDSTREEEEPARRRDSTREEEEPAHRKRSPSLELRESISPMPLSPVASDASASEGGNEVSDSVTPWYEKFFGKRGTGEHRAALGKESSEDDVESVHWKLDYDESTCHSSDSSLSLLSIDSDNEEVAAFERECKSRKLATQSDQSKLLHQEAQCLEHRRKDTRRRVQQFLSGITVTEGAFEAFEQCEEIMMEHVRQSVEALARHAGREKVEDLDVITFIQRYLGTSDPSKLMAQAEELLPAEQCRRLFPPTPNVLLSAKAEEPSPQ